MHNQIMRFHPGHGSVQMTSANLQQGNYYTAAPTITPWMFVYTVGWLLSHFRIPSLSFHKPQMIIHVHPRSLDHQKKYPHVTSPYDSLQQLSFLVSQIVHQLIKYEHQIPIIISVLLYSMDNHSTYLGASRTHISSIKLWTKGRQLT